VERHGEWNSSSPSLDLLGPLVPATAGGARVVLYRPVAGA